MPFNLLKKYPELLELNHLNSYERIRSLKGIFDRDILENLDFSFRNHPIRPTKNIDGISTMEALFKHLTHETEELKNKRGRVYKSRNIFETDRSCRLHWIKYHIDENKADGIEIFSLKERDQKQRRDVTHTYIYNKPKKYVIVLEVQRSKMDYFLLSAYYLNKPWGEKDIKRKIENKLPDIY